MFQKLFKPEVKVKQVGLLQATGLIVYVSLVATLFLYGNDWFGNLNGPFSILGPILFLTLFVVSALVCGLVAFGYPIYLFWDQKKTKESIKIVSYMTLWLLLFLLIIIFLLFITK